MCKSRCFFGFKSKMKLHNDTYRSINHIQTFQLYLEPSLVMDSVQYMTLHFDLQHTEKRICH